MTRRMLAPAGFGVAVFVLIVAGRGDLATPPMHDFGRWLDDRGAVVATVAFVRLAALGAAAWMFVFSTVVLVARAVGAVDFADMVESAVPPAVRRALAVAASVGAVGVPVVGLLTDTGPPSPEALEIDAATTVTMSLLDTVPAPPPADAQASPVAMPVPAAPPPAAATPALDADADADPAADPVVAADPDPDLAAADADPVADADAAAAPDAAADPDPDPAADAASDAASDAEVAPAAAPDPDAWTVGAGESFWSIAEEVVTEQLGRAPTDDEVAPYWRALIEANRGNLFTADPNLLVPGQTLIVPTVT